VYELYNITPGSEWGPDEEKLSKVVVIGRNLNKQALTEWFALTQAGWAQSEGQGTSGVMMSKSAGCLGEMLAQAMHDGNEVVWRRELLKNDGMSEYHASEPIVWEC